MSFGVALTVIVPLDGSIVYFESLSSMFFMAVSMFFQKSILVLLCSEMEDEPPLPCEEPPTLTERDGVLGSVYKTKVRVTNL